MKCKDIFRIVENWAPKGAAWSKDNPGLQVGCSEDDIRGVLLCLEVTLEVIEEAKKKKCNLIISHHPLLFRPLAKLDIQHDPQAKIIESLIKNNITLYSAHTNLDFTKDGVSFQLAKVLGLNNIEFLVPSESNQFKLIVFLPEADLLKVSKALFALGCGNIGEYENCSFSSFGTGTFKGSALSNPTVGKVNKFVTVPEKRFEITIDKWQVSQVIEEIKKVHSYEEPAIDIIPIENINKNFGAGAIGELSRPLAKDKFLKYVSKKLGIKNFRYAETDKTIISKVAVCGGAGIEVLPKALRINADALITADIKYHNFFDAGRNILLIDAGHYETEILVLDEIKERLNKILKNVSFEIHKFSGSTNPINYYR